MKRLEGRVAIVTGAGRGLGREHALFLASQGAKVLVNDLGGDIRGGGDSDLTPAQEVAKEIIELGGEAAVSGHDVSVWAEANEMVQQAIETFGKLDILVNNAGILRDRTLSNMNEEEWDAVIRVHLKGHAAPLCHAMGYWRERSKSGDEVNASVINTSSAAGLFGGYGQGNYAAAKLGIVALSQIGMIEGARYGVRSNVIAPIAATRLVATVQQGPLGGIDAVPPLIDPANVSPLVGWLAAEDCPATGQVFHLYGDRIVVLRMSNVVADLRTTGRWTLEELDDQLPVHLQPFNDPTPLIPTEEELAAPFVS
jgi:NAD(P)-dependent dehydrogenase (short-subunit alcohol dehydrogenase family)